MNEELPTAEQPTLALGYLTLVDSAPMIAAEALGLYEQLGLSVTLHREVSWANLRDKLVAGHYDAVQMLAPLPAMTTLGASGLRAPLITGLVLSRNGNAITLGNHLLPAETDLEAIRQAPTATEAAFRQGAALARHQANQHEPLTFGVVHSFSSHTILIRRWLRQAGLDPDIDARFLVVPPSQMPDSLAQGLIDGFCAGEPWNSQAVADGSGFIATSGVDVWRDAPEKTLCVNDRWQQEHPATHTRLQLALLAACAWLAKPEHRHTFARILSDRLYLDLPEAVLMPALTGELRFHRDEQPRNINDYLIFDPRVAGRPDAAEGQYLIEQCAELIGKAIDPKTVETLIRNTYRSDLFDPVYDYFLRLPLDSALRSPAAPTSLRSAMEDDDERSNAQRP
ncbi:MAG: CmpA/NrtA family ABC transporter substrate-binding protein [Pseudomonadota bacterium]